MKEKTHGGGGGAMRRILASWKGLGCVRRVSIFHRGALTQGWREKEAFIERENEIKVAGGKMLRA